MKSCRTASSVASVAAAAYFFVYVAACEPSNASPPVNAASDTAPPTTTATLPAADASATPVAIDPGDAEAPVAANDPPDITAPPPSTHGASDGGIAPEFTACSKNLDCVAVPRGGCCNNGWLEAVSSQKAADYQQATRCVIRNVMCSHLMANDQRVPHCSSTTHRCEMLPADKTSCGGIAGAKNACPTGYTCRTTSKLPDASGTCRKTSGP